MQAQELLSTLKEQGIAVRPDGDRLRVRPKSRLTPELREELLAHKPELLEFLRSEWPPECRAARERFWQEHALLFPLIGRRVRTPKGEGRLLQVTERTCAVKLDADPSRVTFLEWQTVKPRPAPPAPRHPVQTAPPQRS